jgi:hypothetical protein
MMALNLKLQQKSISIIMAERKAQMTTVTILVSENNTRCHITSDLV